VAELAAVVKGYGEVRRRLFRALERFLDEPLPGAMAEDRRAGADHQRCTAMVRERRLALLTEEQESQS